MVELAVCDRVENFGLEHLFDEELEDAADNSITNFIFLQSAADNSITNFIFLQRNVMEEVYCIE